MRKMISFAIFILMAFSTAAQAYVGLCCAQCGGNMPLNIMGAGVPETYEFRFKLSPSLMRMDGLRDGSASVNGDSLLGMPAMGKSMAVPTAMEMRMLNFSAGYSFTDNFFGGLMFMQKKNSMDMKFNSMMKSSTGRSGYTMESEGMGDIMLMTKYRLYADNPQFPTKQFSLFAGLNLPTGSISEKNSAHPQAARRDEQLPYAMQLGSGTFDPMIGIVYQSSASPWWWGANFIYTGRWYDNSRDYNLGDEFNFDLYSMYQMRHDLVLQFQLNGRQWGKISGEMDEAKSGDSGRATQGDATSAYMTPAWDPANYGGEKIMATVGLQWQPKPMHIIDFTVGVPAYQRLNGPQLEEDFRVGITWYIELPTKGSVRHPDHPSAKRFRGAGTIPSGGN